MRHVTTIYLFAAGALLLTIGASLLLTPQAFYGGNGIALGADPSLLSEIRAPGGLLLSASLAILIGVWRSMWRARAVQLTVLVYGSFGLSRLLAMAVDGMPSASIIAAVVIELVVALLGLALSPRPPERKFSSCSAELTLASCTD